MDVAEVVSPHNLRLTRATALSVPCQILPAFCALICERTPCWTCFRATEVIRNGIFQEQAVTKAHDLEPPPRLLRNPIMPADRSGGDHAKGRPEAFGTPLACLESDPVTLWSGGHPALTRLLVNRSTRRSSRRDGKRSGQLFFPLRCINRHSNRGTVHRAVVDYQAHHIGARLVGRKRGVRRCRSAQGRFAVRRRHRERPAIG